MLLKKIIEGHNGGRIEHWLLLVVVMVLWSTSLQISSNGVKFETNIFFAEFFVHCTCTHSKILYVHTHVQLYNGLRSGPVYRSTVATDRLRSEERCSRCSMQYAAQAVSPRIVSRITNKLVHPPTLYSMISKKKLSGSFVVDSTVTWFFKVQLTDFNRFSEGWKLSSCLILRRIKPIRT